MSGLAEIKVAVVGLGPMGRGIARVFARAGAQVAVLDADRAATARGLELALSESGDPPTLRAAGSVADALAGAALLVEAIVEAPAAKAALLADVRAAAPAGLIVASNTSSLSIGELGASYGVPEQVVGMHFFNPPERMRLVEVVRGPRTSPEVVEAVTAWVQELRKTAVLCEDSPNFIVNRICRPLYYEAQLLATQGVAPAVVDAVARGALGHRVGPLELLDFVGLQTHLGSSETALREFGDPRYRPIPRTRALVRAGATGRAAGRGWYDHATSPPKRAVPAATRQRTRSGTRLSLLGPGRDLQLVNRQLRDAVEPDLTLALYSCPSSCDAQDAHSVRELVLRGARVAVDSSHPGWLDALPPGVGWIRLHALHEAPFAEVVSDREAGIAVAAPVEEILGAIGCASAEVPALPGLVADRLMHTMVNEALLVVEEGTADPRAVDTAMRLGMNHPIGPFEYVERVGEQLVLGSLRGMLDAFGDPRYRPTPLLVRRAARERRRGVPALTDRSLRLPI
jgi:3-hydroxybutyryl-CoA dehydrogenase